MMSHWDDLCTLRAVVVILSAALLAVGRRVLALAETRAARILVADMTLFGALGKTVTG
jgi:hypothetical protein